MRRLVKLFGAICASSILVLLGFRAAAFLRETATAEALAPPNGLFVDTSYGKVHVSEWGDKAARAVVLTHGMAAWGGLWRDIASILAKSGYFVIAIDEAPFGFSDSGYEDYSMKAQGERVAQLLYALGVSHALMVGHSYGGGVALETALRSPELFDGLVLVCPVTKLGTADAAKAGQAPWPLRFTPLAEALVSASATNPWMTKLLLQGFMEKKDMATDAEIEILQRPFARRGNTHATALWFQQFFAGSPDAKTADPANIARLTMPIGFIWGDKDAIASLDEARRLKALTHAARLDVLPGIGHMPQLEAPEAFTQLLLSQLDGLSHPLNPAQVAADPVGAKQ